MTGAERAVTSRAHSAHNSDTTSGLCEKQTLRVEISLARFNQTTAA